MYLGGMKGEREEEGRREGGGRRKEKGGQGRKPGKGASARGRDQDTAIRLPRGHNGVVHVDRSAESNATKKSVIHGHTKHKNSALAHFRTPQV